MNTFQKTLLYFSMINLLLTTSQCASVPLRSIKLSSKWDESMDKPIKCVYVKVNADLSRKDEEMYATIIKSFKKSLSKKGVVVKEDFTWDAPETTLDSSTANLQPDVWLVLGRTFEDLSRSADPLSTPRGFVQSSTNSQGFSLYGRVIQPTIHRQRLMLQMVDPVSKKDVWLGEVSFGREDAKLIGTRIVRHWKAAGLLGSTVTD